MTMDAGKSAYERTRQIELKAEGLFRRDYPTGSFARGGSRNFGRAAPIQWATIIATLRALWGKSRFCLESNIKPHVETDALSAHLPTFV